MLHECSLHELADRRWIGLPNKPQVDQDGHHRTDPASGKRLYTPVVEIPDRAIRKRFQTAALAAVDGLLVGKGSGENVGVARREFRDGSAP